MKYMKPETENAIGCLSAIFWPLGLIMAIFGLVFREKHQNPYIDPELAKSRKEKRAVTHYNAIRTKPNASPESAMQEKNEHKAKYFTANIDIEPWERPPEKMPWEN